MKNPVPGMLRFFLVVATVTSSGSAQNLPRAVIHIDATSPQRQIDGRLWGTNLTNESRTADRTVHDSSFVAASRQIGPRIVRWPGGNNADGYDWKNNVQIKPGRRLPWDGAITLPEIATFCREIGAELSITVNFGTGTPEDAADLVEYCNGPATSEWGSVRASQGFPDPLNVRFFEIGNEIQQPHQWFYSWTAEDPRHYFFGGEEERRGDYVNSPNLDPIGKKGDVFKATGGPGQKYTLRFPPVRNVRVFLAASQQDAESGNFEEWRQVAHLQQSGPGDKVFELDSLSAQLTFGDGVHGAVPAQGSWFLVEYTTYGHRGFVDFARAMRRAPSSVPIKIGAVMGPFVGQKPIASSDSLRMIFEQMDFLVVHQYGAGFPTDTYSRRRQMAYERTQGTAKTKVGRLQAVLDSLGIDKKLGVAITEWNVFLDEDSWRLNRTLEAAVIADEFFIRLLNSGEDFPVWFAEQFALGGVWLALYNNWTSFSISPMGYVFQGFKPWRGKAKVSVSVSSPVGMAYDRELPFINAAAAKSAGGDTLLVAISNSAENQPMGCRLIVDGFRCDRGRLFRLEGDSPVAHSDGGNPFNVILREEPVGPGEMDSILVQPHSVVFAELVSGAASSVAGPRKAQMQTRVWQSYPNPFNSWTRIRYRLSRRARVTIAVYSVTGRKVVSLEQGLSEAGEHLLTWNGEDAFGRPVPSGIYLLAVRAGDFVTSRKLVLLR